MNGNRTITTTITTISTGVSANTEDSSTQLLRLIPERNVTWAEDTIDNEHMNKKSSKRCCIFHKKRNPDESSDSDQEKSPAQTQGRSDDSQKIVGKTTFAIS
ncbi:protein phosphatase inhibitor 3 (I3) [Babesia microti strain RI]|uniref:Protein phosphatase inhibitor 3 (I3) n=1 Tax=Babesia microti (strain RI) TaxID=1133968 RepID=A0A1N6LXV7_BABMR|nr:protein phosphatase inhibitor 3 (I3) [Babesia microti strain RI]SIO73708.1 protein phosphatase inhibitor 3 (I3) [Babesia microti strain RI]|eukprot:XP_021337775.1 protein phosphatase inhibitor 3 (I3) [Babesia microti strain RI]